MTHDCALDDADDVVGFIHYYLHPNDVGLSLRDEGVAVQFNDADPVRVSYADADGARRIMAGPRDAVVERLRSLGYVIEVNDAAEADGLANLAVWVLGAPDPEMEAIEALLRACGERIEYATVYRDGVRRRVRPDEAYAADVAIGDDIRGESTPAIAVECRPAVLFGNNVDGIDWNGPVTTIDHHHPGDPGYGRPPAEFLMASSIGQVICHLDKVSRLPWPEPTAVGHERAPGGPFAGIPHELVLVAAADHCLGAAYRGECPGVNWKELMRWRAESRAKFQRRSVADVLADVRRAMTALESAPEVAVRDEVYVRDMRRDSPIPELPEAAMRLGLGYLSGPLVGPDGTRKYTCSGTAEQVSAFMQIWGPRNGLTRIYGDPTRGFAGGYEDV